MEPDCTPHNETNSPYLYTSKQNKILVFKKNITVINWHQLDMDINVKQLTVLVL